MEEDNKYITYLNKPKEPVEKVVSRRKKRKRARMLATVSFFVILGLVGVGVWALISGAGKKIDLNSLAFWKTTETQVVAEKNTEVENVLEDILGEEEEVVVTPHVKEDPEPTEEELFNAGLDEQIALMPLEEKVMSLFIVRPESITGVETVIQAGDGTKAALEKYTIGGIMYSDKNALSKEQFAEMLEKTQDFSKYPLFLCFNEELGTGSLAKKLGFTSTRTQGEIAKTMDPYAAYTDSKTIADYLKSVGINFNIGFSSDVINPDDDLLVMKDRSYGSDPVIVSRMVQESVNAYKEDGLFVATGFFPGQGSLRDDPETSVASITATVEEIRAKQYDVYKAGIDSGLTAIIISHAYADNLTTGNMPCSMSKEIYKDLLREDFGFSGTILIANCMDSPTITEYYDDDACAKAIKAGADMVMCPDNVDAAVEAVVNAVKEQVIAEERINDSLKRVFRFKYAEEYKNTVSKTYSEDEGSTSDE